MMNRQELVNILESIRPGLAGKEIIEHSTSFIFLDGQVMTYNDEVSVRHPLDIGITGSVPAEPLLNYLKRGKGEKVKFEGGENHLVAQCGRSKAGIPMTAETPDHLSTLKIPTEGWKKTPVDIGAGIKFCLFSAGRDMTKPILTNIHIHGLVVESFDNYRATRYEMKKDIPTDILIPHTSAQYLPNLKLRAYVVDESWVHFQTKEKAIISLRTTAGKYLDISKTFRKKDSFKLSLPTALEDALERAGVFSVADFETDREVNIKVKNGKLTVSATGDLGWFTEKMSSKMGDIDFSTHPDFLKQILTYKAKAFLTKNTLVFVGENFKHSVAI